MDLNKLVSKLNCSGDDDIDANEVFGRFVINCVELGNYREGLLDLTFTDMIRDINDPERPSTLEQLNVLDADRIHVDNKGSHILVEFTPTIPHCSMATLIGLCVRTQLMRSLPSRFKVDVKLTPGSHATESAINKQLADKERVAAALENSHLLGIINDCLTVKDL